MLYRYLTRVNSYSQPDHKKTFFTTPLIAQIDISGKIFAKPLVVTVATNLTSVCKTDTTSAVDSTLGNVSANSCIILDALASLDLKLSVGE